MRRSELLRTFRIRCSAYSQNDSAPLPSLFRTIFSSANSLVMSCLQSSATHALHDWHSPSTA